MVRPESNDFAAPSNAPGFRHLWAAETVRLRESQWGPLSDAVEVRQALAHKGGFAARLLLRAHLLAQREGILNLIRQWSGTARLAMIMLVIAAIAAGAGTAAAALGDASRQVNVLVALTALLGLHMATLLFWLVSLALPAHETHASLGELWLWLTRKLARGPQAALVPRAFVGMLARRGALRPLLGAISHGLWLCALTAMAVTLLALLSARRYTFSWETTLLSPDSFVWLTAVLGKLPAMLGLDMPPEAVVRLSDGLHTLPDSAQAQWSAWLLGAMLCYGIVPRVLALAVTAIQTRRRLSRLTLDVELPGYIELRERLDPPSLTGDIDAPAPRHILAGTNKHAGTAAITQDALIAGIELPSDIPWPPADLGPEIGDMGIADSRSERQRLLQHLQSRPPTRLLIACDARQTPDRGTLALVAELASMAARARILLLHGGSDGAPSARMQAWHQGLSDIKMHGDTVHSDPGAALTWLQALSDNESPTHKDAS